MMENGSRKSSEVTMFCNRTAGVTYICKTWKNTFSHILKNLNVHKNKEKIYWGHFQSSVRYL